MPKNKKIRRKGRNRRAALASTRVLVQPRLREIRIRNREFVTTVDHSSSATTLVAFPINPGLPSIFPWLSQIAPAFEKYHFTRLQYEYIPTVAATVSGSVVIAPDYDPDDDDSLATEARLSCYADSVSGAAWAPMTCVCAPKHMKVAVGFRHFVRQQSTAEYDKRMSDVGQLLVFTGVGSGDGVIGKLFCSYDVTFYVPQVSEEHPVSTSVINFDSTTGNPFNSVGAVRGVNDYALERESGSSETNHLQVKAWVPDQDLLLNLQAAGTSLSNWLQPALHNTIAGDTITTITGGLVNATSTLMSGLYRIHFAHGMRSKPPVISWNGLTGTGMNTNVRLTGYDEEATS